MNENNRDYQEIRSDNVDPSLGYSRTGLSGFGCTVVFLILGFIISIRDIVEAETLQESFMYIMIVLFTTFCVFIYNLIDYFYYKKINTIKEKGTIVRGFISDIKTRVRGYEDSKELKFSLIVDYRDPETGKDVRYSTPFVNFDPFKKLGSRYCNVYVYKGKAFVTDFEKKQGSEIIFFLEDFPEIHVDNVRARFFISHIIDFLIPIVIVFIIYGIISILRNL